MGHHWDFKNIAYFQSCVLVALFGALISSTTYCVLSKIGDLRMTSRPALCAARRSPLYMFIDKQTFWRAITFWWNNIYLVMHDSTKQRWHISHNIRFAVNEYQVQYLCMTCVNKCSRPDRERNEAAFVALDLVLFLHCVTPFSCIALWRILTLRRYILIWARTTWIFMS